ncbi:MAG: hypothetical protein HC919_00385 [Oscillatoriales cyanobacterium SM2_2_1]|nr:hypothetical protein [Oscillatoriales cyanobacterium SM2_2_1]
MGRRSEGRLQQYLSLVPVFGLVPAVLGLLRQRCDRQTKNTNKVAIALMLAWLTSVAAVDGLPLTEFTDGLAKGTFGMMYVVVCVWLMAKVFRGRPVELPWDMDKR